MIQLLFIVILLMYPSKVKAAVEAVKQQYANRKLIAVLELHTFSSLDKDFMSEYTGAMDKADEAAVFYSKHALELKRLPELTTQVVLNGFAKENLEVITNKDQLVVWFGHRNFQNAALVFMSSGNYDGFDIKNFAEKITAH